MTNDELKLCRDWATEPNRKWQTLNRSEWKYRFHEKTLVRYVDEASMSESIAALLCAWLCSDDCKSYLQLYGQAVGSEWSPIRAWYEVSNKAVGAVRAVRLYHALSTAVDGAADGPYVVENGCAYKVSWEYYWKQATVATVPASTSGVSYHIANLSRDPETGLYTYAIEKRERVQQDIAEYVTQTTEFEERTEEQHLGVRGAESVGGKKASAGGGKIVTRKVSKNADCTHDVQNTTVKEKTVKGASESVQVTVTGTRTVTDNRSMASKASTAGLKPGESVQNEKTPGGRWNQRIVKLTRDALVWIGERCRNTIFSHVHTTTTNVKDKPKFDHVKEASGGKITEKSVRKTEDGYAIDESVAEEKPVAGAVVEFRKGLMGTTVTVTDKNQAQGLNGSGMVIGESRRTQKTEGGLNDNTVSKPTAEAAGKIAKGARDTVFASEESETENIAAGGRLPDPGVAKAKGGETETVDVRMQENGSANVTKRKRKEKRVKGATIEVRKTLQGTQRMVTDLGQSQAVSENGLEIGETRRSQLTEGGKYNNTVTKMTPVPTGEIGRDEEDSIFQKRTATHKNVATNPGGGVTTAGGGKVRSKRTRRNNAGTWDVTEGVTDEHYVANAVVRKTKTINGVVTQRTNRNGSGGGESPQEIGDSVVEEKTPGGKTTVTTTTGGHEGAGKVSVTKSESKFAKTTRTVTNKKGKGDGNVTVTFSDGKIIRKGEQTNGNGTHDVVEETTETKEVDHEYNYHTGGDGPKVYVKKYKNLKKKPKCDNDKAWDIRIDDSINEAGRHEGSMTYKVGGLKIVESDFTRHGQACDYYQVDYRGKKNLRHCRKFTLKLVWTRGAMYSKFVSDAMMAESNLCNALGSDNGGRGVVGTKLISKYLDKDGNLRCEYIYVSLTNKEGWKVCDKNHKHAMSWGDDDIRQAVADLLQTGIPAGVK